MKLHRPFPACLLTCLCALILLAALTGSAAAEPNAPPVKIPSLFTPVATQLQSLINGVTTGTSAPAATTPVGTAAPAAAPAGGTPVAGPPAPAPDDEENPAVLEQTFGTKALNIALNAADIMRLELASLTSSAGGLTEFDTWLTRQTADQRHIQRWAAIGANLLNVIGIALLAAATLDLLLWPAWNRLRKRVPPTQVRRLVPFMAYLGLRLLTILLFVGLSLTLLDRSDSERLPRFVILNVIYAVTISYAALALLRALLEPKNPDLRLFPIRTSQATYAWRWTSFFALVITYGYFCLDVARIVFMPHIVQTTFGNTLGFLLIVMAITVIVQKRAFIAAMIRGDLSAARPDLTVVQSLRLWLARRWHILALLYLVVGYGIAVIVSENGFVSLLRGTILTLIILIVTIYLLRLLDRGGMKEDAGSDGRALHRSALRLLMRPVIVCLALLADAGAWGLDVAGLFATPFGQRTLGAVLSIGITIVVVTLVYETFNAAVERHLNRRDSEGKLVQAGARARTLLPLIRNTAFIGFAIIVGFVALSSVGINVAPLLAGAGVIGVAIGFGSQALVKDFLTGLFIIIENVVSIGDVVKIGTHSGVVEGLSIRTLRIRDSDGSLHIIPFSEVTDVINMTRDFAFAQVNIDVAYDSDLEHVMQVIRSVGEELQQDPVFKRVILESIEVFGVDKFNDSSITIASRIRTRPGKQWDVKRRFFLKLKQRFDKEGISIPFPTVTSLQYNVSPPPAEKP